MINRIILTIIFTLVSITINAQDVTGRVLEKRGDSLKPLVGATVIQLNTQNGTITDKNGNFSLSLISNKEPAIVTSFVSYLNDTVLLKKNMYSDINIILNESKRLNEVEIVSRGKGSSMSRTETRSVVNMLQRELQKAACCNLSESFENSATVDVSYSDAVTGAKQIKMLGLAGIYTQVLTENMPNMRGLATPWGLGYIPGSWMQSIQVSKGTSSVTNGYESMAGQINVEFKKTDEGEKFFLNLYGNHMGKIEGNVNTRFKISDKLSTAILAHAENFSVKHDLNDDSFIDKPLVSQINFFNRWRYINKQIMSRFGFKVLSENRSGGQVRFDPKKEHNIENGYGIGIKTTRYEAFLKGGWVSKKRTLTNIGVQNQVVYHEQNSFFGLNSYDATQFSYYGNIMYQSWIGNTRNQFTSGISMNYDHYNENLNDSLFTRTEVVPGGFLQYNYSNCNTLSVIVGLRLDNNSLYGLLFTPRVHAKYNINEQNVIRVSGGKGYRSPNVIAENTSLLATSRKIIVTEKLDIESSWNYGLSYTTYLNIGARELSISADVFRTQFENQIVIDRENDPSIIYMYNLNGASFSNSFQIEAGYELIKNLELTLAFRYNDVKTTINDELIEKPLVNKYKGLLAASYQTPEGKWQIDLNVQAVGNQRLPYTGYNPQEYQLPEFAPDYMLINSQITRYFKQIDVYVGGENLGNYRQLNPIIAPEDPFGKYFDSSIIWGPITGIKIYAGLRFRIE